MLAEKLERMKLVAYGAVFIETIGLAIEMYQEVTSHIGDFTF
jgi:hypothetical protein